MEESFLKLIEHSIKEHWNLPSLSDYQGANHTYKDVARRVEKLHILFKESDIHPGDRIALCSRNTANWGIAFLAALTYGAVAVPILNEFKPDTIHHIINHSGARLLFVGKSVWDEIDHEDMPDLDGILAMSDYSVIFSRNNKLEETNTRLNELFGQKYPERFTAEDVLYRVDAPEELAMINYTSGTTSSPKGVMLPYRSMWSNLRYALDQMGYNPGEKLVSILTMAHMYGLAFEFIYPFTSGTHIYFLQKMPSPKILNEVFTEIRPHLIVAVPLIIEKIIKKRVLSQLDKFHIKLMLKIPVLNGKIRHKIKQKILDAFGGRFKLLAIGGAALNKEVEAFLHSVKFPYTVGYGMTECGPAIAFDHWDTFRPTSCGKVVDRMELKIASSDPEHVVGEILTRGMNVMDGYYENPEATNVVLDSDKWLHTGDLGIIDKDGYLYIKGRSKNLILGPSGQNIYPEEIEDYLNVMPYIAESLVIEREGKLIGLIYPDFEAMKQNKISEENLSRILEESRKQVNQQLPSYSQIARIMIHNEEFEKTPKRSIKRYLYQ
ncbi:MULTISPECIES: AMP-binding protein [Sanguibacteroides]|uniref:Long-chain fatty acid--CoA ligase n=1 Tax=Sanguibacteroides justesenii TaxID=1547597 RepID=A0AB34R0V6_9PORP|nr:MULTISPECIES: AMP-binding protein [Sanguibacteroides]KIO43262.1 long-chain fatty acid--CoA ligase [Sanguibacteroides justesenii]PXZ42867.1 long-chain fatty acid--CoA ligase [Sanguibacteroides justesenii]